MSKRLIHAWSEFRALPASERALVARAWVAFGLVASSVRLAGFRRTHRFLERRLAGGAGAAPERGARPGLDRDRIVELVSRAKRYSILRSSCLDASLVLWWLLRRHGHPASLVIGAAVEEAGVRGHAWVEAGETTFGLGTPDRDRYAPMLTYRGGELPASWPVRHGATEPMHRRRA